MIRILHIVSSLNINAGVMSVIMNYYRHIDRKEIQFDFLYYYEMNESHGPEIEGLGGRIFYITPPSFSPSYQKGLDIFFKEHRGEFAAVHCHDIFGPQVYGWAAKKSGIRHVIVHSHTTKFSDKRLSALRNWMLNLFVGLFATDFMACSPEAGRLFGRRKVRQLNNAIDCGRFRFDEERRTEIRRELGIGQNVPVLGHVGRFSPQKNHAFILEIFDQVHRIMPEVRLLLVGHGELYDEVQEIIRSRGLVGSVICTGKRSDVPELLSVMDMFLLPSLFEGAPVSVIEAEATGLPCLMSDVVTRCVAVENCIYLPLLAPASLWAERATDLVKRSTDRSGAAEKMGIAGFDIYQEAEKLAEFYSGLLS